jgi:hypothetical protein
MSNSNTHTQIACELIENSENRYQMTLDVASLAKRLLEDVREQRKNDPFALESHDVDDRVIYQALIMKASEIDLGDGLIG